LNFLGNVLVFGLPKTKHIQQYFSKFLGAVNVD